MLVAQAKKASEIFLGKEIDDDVIDKICRDIKQNSQNIVLIGMPGCGKSTIGQLVSNELGRDFFDSDSVFFEKYGKTPAETIISEGEDSFRKKETSIIAELGKKSGTVISTGGGAVLRKENRDALCQNGTVVLLKRPLSMLGTDGRPLSSSIERLEQMDRDRMPVYEAFCDICIENTSEIEDAAKAIIEKI